MPPAHAAQNRVRCAKSGIRNPLANPYVGARARCAFLTPDSYVALSARTPGGFATTTAHEPYPWWPLVTCGGHFDAAAGGYTRNVNAFARMRPG